ncbi:MAG: hypothetical protein KDA71_14470, partial [Planctomycetales bacterium]|nr:hypothetical protein [Planctomycetales bacterium]
MWREIDTVDVSDQIERRSSGVRFAVDLGDFGVEFARAKFGVFAGFAGKGDRIAQIQQVIPDSLDAFETA